MELRSCRMSAVMVVLMAFACANTLFAGGDDPGSPARTKFDPARDAASDIAKAVEVAAKEGKHVLLDVGGEWCIWCHRLDSLYIKNPDLEKYLLDNYIVVKVNVSKENKNEKVLSEYPQVAGYPHLFVLDAKGKLLHSQNTGDLEEGKGHSKEKVLAFLKQWAPRR